MANPGNTAPGIRLSQNRIFGSTGLELDLTPPDPPFNVILGVTNHDDGDPDSGTNSLQNFPAISSAVSDGVEISLDYSFNSEASKEFALEFFYTDTSDASGHGGAQAYLGETAVNTDGSGNVSGQLDLAFAEQAGFVTATAINAVNGTSEFSACAEFTAPDGNIFADGFENLPP